MGPSSAVARLLLAWHTSTNHFLSVCCRGTRSEGGRSKEPEHFLSRSRPVAAKAKQAHSTTLKHIQAPWWKKLGEEPGDKIDVPKDDLSIELGTLFIDGTTPPEGNCESQQSYISGDC